MDYFSFCGKILSRLIWIFCIQKKYVVRFWSYNYVYLNDKIFWCRSNETIFANCVIIGHANWNLFKYCNRKNYHFQKWLVLGRKYISQKWIHLQMLSRSLQPFVIDFLLNWYSFMSKGTFEDWRLFDFIIYQRHNI